MTAISTFHESTFAFFKETTHGIGAGGSASSPAATQAGIEAAELAGTCDRVRHYEADPSWIQVSRVEDDALVDSVFAKNVPITGLGTAEGGSIVLGLAGAGATTADTVAITETPAMTLLEHCLGGMVLGTGATVAAPIVSAAAYDLSSATGQEVGMIIAVADADDANKLFSQQIKTLSGTTATFDEMVDFTPVASDVCHPCATLFPSSADLECDGTNYSTLSLYYQKGDHNWQATGCKLQLDSITMARGEQPKMNLSAWATNCFPPSGSSITAPVWTGSVEGPAGIPVGVGTVLRISQNATTAHVCVDAETLDFQAGVPVVPLDTATGCDGANEGRAGFTTQPGDTTLTAQVFLATGWQDNFDSNAAMEVTIEQRSAAGSFWCIKLPKCYMHASPGYAQSQATNMQTLVFTAHENDLTNASTPELAKAKFLIGIG